MHKNATKCNETLNKWCKNKHGALKIMDTLETYQSSIAVPNNILTIGHMTKSDIATQGSLQLNSGYQTALMTHVMPTTLQATDWETFLVRASVVVPMTIFIKVFLQV
jgi:hypothetical protein